MKDKMSAVRQMQNLRFDEEVFDNWMKGIWDFWLRRKLKNIRLEKKKREAKSVGGKTVGGKRLDPSTSHDTEDSSILDTAPERQVASLANQLRSTLSSEAPAPAVKHHLEPAFFESERPAKVRAMSPMDRTVEKMLTWALDSHCITVTQLSHFVEEYTQDHGLNCEKEDNLTPWASGVSACSATPRTPMFPIILIG
jgi:hypothetical protein